MSVIQVVDIGSGKGYLGAELSRTFNIPVLGLDSQETNTHGAKRRELILNKRFKKKKQQVKIFSLIPNVFKLKFILAGLL